MAQQNQGWYPSSWLPTKRMPDGSLLLPDGTMLPFGAACPPETAPDLASNTCIASPGARNVNFECGGLLAPLGSPGCEVPGASTMVMAPPSMADDFAPPSRDGFVPWPDACGGRNPDPDPGAGGSTGLPLCLLAALGLYLLLRRDGGYRR